MKAAIIVIISFFLNSSVRAQHGDHSHKKDTTKKVTVAAPKTSATMPRDTIKPRAQVENHQGHDHDQQVRTPSATAHQHDGHAQGEEHNMSHAYSLNLPMTRNGSGTSWQPDNSPMYGYMFHSAKWMYMVHGNLFLRYNKQDLFDRGSRGDAKFDAPNMWMFTGQRKVGEKGLFHFSTMISFDPLTVGESGYPLLFQTGETYKGAPLIDRQHPHDLFSELSVGYSHAISPESDIFLYLGYPGEPALGPSAFVHRPSGFMNPDAPLTHHWIDATHITFGVATLGFRQGNFKLEGSSFTGREPDENRYNFDKPRFDSWSGRLSYNPSAKWAMQISHGFIKEPEVLHPGEDVNRTTASLQFSQRGFGESFTNFSMIWGMNKTDGHKGEHGVLLEGSHQQRKTTVYSRYEFVQKSVEELGLDETEFGHDVLFPTHALTAGVGYDILKIGQTRMAIGAQTTFFIPDKRLTDLYGDSPIAGQVYLRLYPRAMGRQDGKFYLPF
jgi:hypothetical protein